jgi:hypothetical protein
MAKRSDGMIALTERLLELEMALRKRSMDTIQRIN